MSTSYCNPSAWLGDWVGAGVERIAVSEGFCQVGFGRSGGQAGAVGLIMHVIYSMIPTFVEAHTTWFNIRNAIGSKMAKTAAIRVRGA